MIDILFPNSWYNYRVLIGYFRESPRGSQNLVLHGAGLKSSSLFLTTVPHFPHFLGSRCRTGAGSHGGPPWSHFGPLSVPFWLHFGPQFGLNLGPVWFHFGFQFGPNYVPVWSQFGPRLVPVWSQIGPSLVPVWSQIGSSLVAVWFHFGFILEPSLVPI